MLPPSFSTLARTRVLFGHQSVGQNIVEGVRDLLRDHEGSWRVVERVGGGAAGEGFLAHVRVGRNGDPLSKTADFAGALTGEPGTRVDIALHKYCYADVDARTDVNALFASYRSAMRAVQACRPGVAVVHVTIPLVRVRTGISARVLRMAGRPAPRVDDNARREQFNDRMRAEYHGREPLWDLAALESDSSGAVRSLRADYTTDGGHLNEVARRAIASDLLACLAGVAASS